MTNDGNPLLKTTSHFTYDLVAGILPGFAGICTGYFVWHFIERNAGVKAMPTDLPPDTSSSIILLVGLLVVSQLLGSVCTAMARGMKWIVRKKPKFECVFPNDERIQERVNAVFKLSKHWPAGTWLKVKDNGDHRYAVKWVVRRLAVHGDENSLVTTYHYKYHLYRALVMVWLIHAGIALVLGGWGALAACGLLAGVQYQLLDILWYLLFSALLALVTWYTWSYYYERYWMALATEFCLRERNLVTDSFLETVLSQPSD